MLKRHQNSKQIFNSFCPCTMYLHYWLLRILRSFKKTSTLTLKIFLHNIFMNDLKDGFWTTFWRLSWLFFLFSNSILITRTVKVPLILFLKYDCRKDFTALWPSVYTLLLSNWLQLPAVSNNWNSDKNNIPLTFWHFPPNSHFHYLVFGPLDGERKYEAAKFIVSRIAQ